MVRVGDDAAPRRPRRNIAQKAAHALASMTSAPTVTHSFNELHDLRQTVSNPGLTPMERPEEIEAFGRQQRAGSGDDRRVRLLNALMPLAGEAEESCTRAACDDNTCQKMVNTRGVLYARAEKAMRHAEEDLINELRQRRNHRYARACGDSALLRMLHIPMGRSGDGGVEEAEDTPDEDEDVEAEAAEGEASGVDLLVGMIFQRLPKRAGVSGADDLLWRSTTQRDLRRMWLGTFGRLPVASGLALKHRIGSGIQQKSPGQRPRMLVPPPILPGTELPPMRRSSSRSSGSRAK